MSHTKGKLEVKKISDKVCRIFANVPKSKEAIAHTEWIGNVWDEANAKEMTRRWNAFEEDGLVTELLEALKAALRIKKLWLPGSNNVEPEHKSEVLALNAMSMAFEAAIDSAESQ